MIYTDKTEFLSTINSKSKILGLDVGTKTIGIAICDFTRTIASPFKTIARKKFSTDVIELKKIIDENSISGLVIGIPIGMGGGESKMTQSIRQFARNLLKEFDIPILFWDERFSTNAVERSLLDAEMSRQKRDEVIDKMAASYILQGFLDSI